MNSAVLDEAPTDLTLVTYDKIHLQTYLRLLDAASAGADPPEVARILLGIDAVAEPERARRCYDSHLARARWVADRGYLELLRGGRP